ncbi:MAG: NUDIX hydrolase [Rubricoccaceae bacterium]
MSDSRRWTTLSTRILIERWWMTLRVDRVQLPHGPLLDEYHVVEYPHWACVLALTPEGDAVMVEQYRYGIDRMSLECPAGAIDPGEDALAAAKRELLEETGYEAGRWTPLGALAIEPTRHTNYGHVFVAHDARRIAEPTLDDSEDLTTQLVPASSLPERIRTGEIIHGIHVAAVLWAEREGLLMTEDG